MDGVNVKATATASILLGQDNNRHVPPEIQVGVAKGIAC